MLSRNEIEAGLPQFTGTTQYYRSHPGLLLTDGAKWLAESRVLLAIRHHLDVSARNSEGRRSPACT